MLSLAKKYFFLLLSSFLCIGLNAQTNGQWTKEEANKLFEQTTSVNDPNFSLIQKNAKEFDRLLGAGSVKNKLMAIIYFSLIQSEVEGHQIVDWKKIRHNVKPYSSLGKEIYLKAKWADYYNKKDWKNFALSAKQYHKAGFQNDNWELNNWAFYVFEHVKEKKILKTALGWSRQVLADTIKYPNDQIGKAKQIDTYANLLYKLGKTNKAIELEAYALSIAKAAGMKNTKEFDVPYNKMLRGEPTWKE